MEYDTIIHSNVAIRPAKTLRKWDDTSKTWSSLYFGPVTWMSPPPNATKSYDPELKIVKFRNDPSKGRNFTALRKAGVIAVSPLHVVNTSTQDFLAQAEHVFKGHGFLQTSGTYYGAPTCFEYIDTSPYLDCRWTEQGDFSHWSFVLRDKYYKSNVISGQDITDAIAITQQEAMSDALTGYDLLSELGELKETLRFLLGNISSLAGLISSIRHLDPVSWKVGKSMTPKQLLNSSDRALRTLGHRWLEFRYALMPLIYSMRDIIEASKGDIIWKTSRSKRVLKPSPYLPDLLNISSQKTYLVEDITGEITVRSFVKQHYKLTGLANLLGARITFNPFITAWELTRLSFVVDWLLNLGNLITLCTAPNLSDQMVLVTSVRDQTVKTTYLVDRSSDVKVSSWTVSTPCVSPASFTETYTRSIYQPLRTTITNSYNRFIPTEVDSRVIFDLNLNWKRILDALALLYSPTKTILRSLK